MDYFIKYAGIDENGNQTGPMKGGVIIFGSGNENITYCIPGSYKPVIAVAALASDYQAACYTNYGDWVDTSAPGGDSKKGYQICSTVPDNMYDLWSGTSMACLHVSGVAALIISHFGGPGFTNDMLKERLLNSANDIIYDYNDSKYTGLLGSGLVDAGAAFSFSTIAPDPITTYSTSVVSNKIILTFTVPEDEDGIVPSGVKIYYSKKEIPSDLDFSTTYYFALQSYDSSDNYSSLTNCFSENTEQNRPPVLTRNNDSPVIIHYHESTEINFTISDPEDQSVTISTDTGSTAATFSSGNLTNSIVGKLSIIGSKAEEGTYNFMITAIDENNAKATYNIEYTILPNNPPTTTGEIDNIVFNSISESKTFSLNNYFNDIDKESLNYSVEQSNSDVTEVTILDGKLQITPSKYGSTDVNVTASDAKGESCSLTFTILVRSDSNPVDIYPNPVRSIVSVRPGTIMNNVTITFTNTSGAQVKKINTISTGPFSPVKVDLSDVAAGIYSVKLTSSDNDEFKSSIIKL